MQLTTARRNGRPPVRPADGATHAVLSVRLPAEIKHLLIDQADAYDMSLAEYISTLVSRDVSESRPPGAESPA